MSFQAIPGNKIIAKILEFTVTNVLITDGQADLHLCCLQTKSDFHIYNKTCLKRPLKNRQNKGLKDKW